MTGRPGRRIQGLEAIRIDVANQTDLGQHLLTESRAVERIIRSASLQAGEHVLDAGAGAGALTRPIADQVGSNGRVYAVEIDPDMLERLRADLPPQVETVAMDLLEMKVPDRIDAVVSNPPFKIAAPFIERVAAAQIPRAIFVLPRELIERLVAPPGTERYGPLTIRIALLADCEDLGAITRHAFTPPPEVPCGLLRMSTKSDAMVVDPEIITQVLDAARAGWNQKAKQAFDALARSHRIDSAGLTQVLKDHDWADKRTADLPPRAFGMIARYLDASR